MMTSIGMFHMHKSNLPYWNHEGGGGESKSCLHTWKTSMASELVCCEALIHYFVLGEPHTEPGSTDKYISVFYNE